MAQKQQLVRLGARDHDLTRAVRSGEVVRARNGWYTTLPETSPEVRAVRVGGRLTGISAIISMGGWALGDFPLHVSIADNAARLRTQFNRFVRLDVAETRGVRLHWDPPEVGSFGTATLVGVPHALYRVILDESFETAVAALDWALNCGALEGRELGALARALPADRRGICVWADQECQSLPESLTRTRLLLEGHAVVSQVPLASGHCIDLVVDQTVAVEVDGEQFHHNTFERDRLKDLAITTAGFHCIRPSARSVFTRWDTVSTAIDVALARRGVVHPIGISGNSGSRHALGHGISAWNAQRLTQSPEFPKS